MKKLMLLYGLFWLLRKRTKTYESKHKMSTDFSVRQSEGYNFIIDTEEHVRIAVHGSEEERSAAVARYIEACRINYMSVSEAVAFWRFAATSQEAYLAGLPLIHAAEATAAAADA